MWKRSTIFRYPQICSNKSLIGQVSFPENTPYHLLPKPKIIFLQIKGKNLWCNGNTSWAACAQELFDVLNGCAARRDLIVLPLTHFPVLWKVLKMGGMAGGSSMCVCVLGVDVVLFLVANEEVLIENYELGVAKVLGHSGYKIYSVFWREPC